MRSQTWGQTWEDCEVTVVRERDVKFPNNQQAYKNEKKGLWLQYGMFV